jgi:hypothetical protein
VDSSSEEEGSSSGEEEEQGIDIEFPRENAQDLL